jgi:hypothetical protein
MPSPYATKLAEGFSAKVSKEMYASSLFDTLVNRDYEGEITGIGSLLNILSFSKILEKDYTGANLSPDDLNESNGQLKIDKQKSFYFKVKTIDKFNSYIKEPKSTITDQTFNERKKNIDIYVLGKYAQVAAGQRVGTDYVTGTVTVTTVTGAVVGSGTTFTSAMVGRGFKATGHSKWYRVSAFTDTTHITIINDSDDETASYDGGTITGATYTIEAVTPIQLTTSNILQYIMKMKQLFDDNEVPLENRKLVLPAVVETLIPRASNIALQTESAYQELIKKGFINTIGGFDIFSSARLNGDNVNGFHALAIQTNWQTFADKVLEAEIEENLQGNFGAAFKDLYVYGSKIKDNRRKFACELFCYV